MLILDTPAQERASRSGAKERTLAQRNAALAQEIQSNTISVRTDAGRDTSSLLEQMGRPLTSTEVQRRLLLCNPRLIFERSIRYPSLTGVYIEKDERTAAGTWGKRKIHLFGMESGILPEFSVLHQTTKRVPNPELIAAMGDKKPFPRDGVKWVDVPTFEGETRGWRTVLIRLLHLELITRGQVDEHFGWTPSRPSERWAALTE
jgi:hypothetical protein